MGVTKRRLRRMQARKEESSSKTAKKKNGFGTRGLVFLFASLCFTLFNRIDDVSSVVSQFSEEVGTFHIDQDVTVSFEWQRLQDPSAVSLGSHKAIATFPKTCERPSLWIRLEGDALVGLVLNERSTTWEGNFAIPAAGQYEIVSYWYGCDGNSDLQRKSLLNITAVGNPSNITSGTGLFPESSWLSSKQFPHAHASDQKYIWHNPHILPRTSNLLKTSSTIISKESTISEAGFYSFSELSNYELVCWIGSDSARAIREAFLQLKAVLFPNQRPFKFHLYESSSFVKPDTDWSEETKKRLRKCKHILVSMDEVQTPVSQAEYTDQVTIFLNHLLKVLPDETFPIWMFTTMESPTKPTNCLQPTLPRSSHHPCNTALKELFRESPFPSRVRFLDNTDITLPQLGDNRNIVVNAIALRIFVFVGKQVTEWRNKGQIGNVKGLQRGDVLEPNFELVPYIGWA